MPYFLLEVTCTHSSSFSDETDGLSYVFFCMWFTYSACFPVLSVLFQLYCRGSSTHVIIHSHARGAHASCRTLLSPESDIYYLFCRWRGSNLTQRLSSPSRHTWWPTTQGSLWHTMDITLGNCTSRMSRQMTAERTCVRSTRIQWEVRYMPCIHPARFPAGVWPTFEEIINVFIQSNYKFQAQFRTNTILKIHQYYIDFLAVTGDVLQ